MLRTAALLALCGSLAACATADEFGMSTDTFWRSEKRVDNFSDQVICRVRPRDVELNRALYGAGIRLYPFIEKRGDQVIVGIYDGGGLDFPVGDVQIRIGNNPPYDLDDAATPSLVPGKSAIGAGYTAAGGSKGKAMLAEMVAATTVIRYRGTDIHLSGVEGAAPIDPSFYAALVACGL
jgi:hypothetical protein